MSIQKYPQTKLIRRATQLFPHQEHTSRKGVKHLRREWVKCINYLGPKWLLADCNAVQRKDKTQGETA